MRHFSVTDKCEVSVHHSTVHTPQLSFPPKNLLRSAQSSSCTSPRVVRASCTTPRDSPHTTGCSPVIVQHGHRHPHSQSLPSYFLRNVAIPRCFLVETCKRKLSLFLPCRFERAARPLSDARWTHRTPLVQKQRILEHNRITCWQGYLTRISHICTVFKSNEGQI